MSVGDTLTYTVTATNTGTANLTNVTVTDNKITPTGGTTPCALVAPGGTCTLVGTYVVSAADITAGQIDNTATVNATDPGGNPVGDTDDETVPVAQDPSIDLVKSLLSNADEDASGDVSLDDTLTYQFVATNDGTVTLAGVTITDPLPGLSALSCAPVAGSSLAPTASMSTQRRLRPPPALQDPSSLCGVMPGSM